MTDDYSETATALAAVLDNIHAAERRFNRASGSVRLIAVSKTKPVAQIRVAIAAGQQDFGENYLDEALQKIAELQDFDCKWHFIGHIQSNKTKHVAAHFDWAHCLDREKIARRLSDQRPPAMAPLNVCIQVNIDDEQSKSGVDPAEAGALADAIADMPSLRLRGLMAIPRPADSFDRQREPFARLRDLFEQIRAAHPDMDTLSMGMSGDIDAAIAEGATMVRVGTAIFGARAAKG